MNNGNLNSNNYSLTLDFKTRISSTIGRKIFKNEELKDKSLSLFNHCKERKMSHRQ